MSCLQTLNGIAKDCSPNKGGVKRVYIANFEEMKATVDESTGIATIQAVGGGKFKKYEFPRGLASMISPATIDPSTGARYFTTDVSLFFNRMEATKRMEIMALFVADAMVVVEDENGTLWLPDYENPMVCSASENGTGTAVGDANRYGITLQVMSDALPYVVSSIDELVE